MSKNFSRKRAASDEYEADGGFVEDAPKSKKTKAAASQSKGKDSDSEYWEVSGSWSLLQYTKADT